MLVVYDCISTTDYFVRSGFFWVKRQSKYFLKLHSVSNEPFMQNISLCYVDLSSVQTFV